MRNDFYYPTTHIPSPDMTREKQKKLKYNSVSHIRLAGYVSTSGERNVRIINEPLALFGLSVEKELTG
jgi:hypothetical protein